MNRSAPFLVLPAVRRPWNPTVIAWLGVLFSPVWTGIMAALNIRRLGLTHPWWRPILIGVAYVVVDLAVSLWIIDSLWLDLALYAGALVLIWQLDLQPQTSPYENHIRQQRPAGIWLGPCLAGAPVTLFLLLGLFAEVLFPMSPREVCYRFLQADTENEMKRYTTIKLWQAISALAKAPDEGNKVDVELLDEAHGTVPDEYLVGLRFVSVERGQAVRIEGYFHLVGRDRAWKIEDIYYVAVNDQPLAQPIVLSRDYPLFVQAARQPPPPERKKDFWQANQDKMRGLRGLAPLLSNKGFWRGIAVVLLAIGAGATMLGRKIKDQTRAV